jgi:hypothetical protein
MVARSKPKVEEGREFARAILVQDDDELQVHDGVARDCNPMALRNPVVRKLREQVRLGGIGPKEYQLPASVFTHLMDRWAGRVLDRMKLTVDERPYEGETDEQLVERLETLKAALKKKDEEA